MFQFSQKLQQLEGTLAQTNQVLHCQLCGGMLMVNVLFKMRIRASTSTIQPLCERTRKPEDVILQFVQVSLSNHKSTEASIKRWEVQ